MMRRSFSLLSSTCAVALLPAVALADVTPEDVWANAQASLDAIGGTTTAEVARDGDVLTVSDIEVVFDLPMGAGQATGNFGTVTFTDKGDGTVAVGGPDEQEWRLGVDVEGEGGVTVTMMMRVSEYDATASGTPDEVTYDYDIGTYAFDVTDIALSGSWEEDAGEFDVGGTMTLNDLAGTYTFRDGAELFTITNEGSVDSGTMEFDFSFSEGEGEDRETVTGTQTSTFGTMSGEGELSVPAGGVVLTELAAALRDGLLLDYSYVSELQESEQVIMSGEQLLSRQTDRITGNEGHLRLDAEGVRLSGSAEEYALQMQQPMLPVPLSFTLDGIEAAFEMPLLSGEEPVTALIRGRTDGLTIDDAIWALFDPQEQLPREPAVIALDATASVRPTVDLVDLEALSGLEESGASPFDLYDVTLTELNVEAAGAAASAEGAFTFDNDDLETFDGFPAPDGSATIRLSGVNALLTTLVEMGLVPEQDAMGARMMLGGFAQPEGEDGYVSEIVIDGETGRITAGGQRIR